MRIQFYMIPFFLFSVAQAKSYKLLCCEKKAKDPCCYTTTVLSERGAANLQNQKDYTCRTQEQITEALEYLSNEAKKGTK